MLTKNSMEDAKINYSSVVDIYYHVIINFIITASTCEESN